MGPWRHTGILQCLESVWKGMGEAWARRTEKPISRIQCFMARRNTGNDSGHSMEASAESGNSERLHA